ncbi:MAG: ECF transporter S component [Clostridia bacterium]|nr:ECF transporter S component [Clostridia bacterium]
MKKNTRTLILTALFVAIIAILAATPLGLIQLPVIKATILHIPVIIGSIVLGPKIGAFLGVCFGTASIISNTTMPTLLSFAFSPFIPLPTADEGSLWALAVCFVPRILVGVTPYFVYRLLQKLMKDNKIGEVFSLAAAGFIGSMTNTVLVMGGIYVIFRDAYAAVQNVPAEAVFGLVGTVIATSGVSEAIAATLITAAVGKALLVVIKK